MIKYIKRRFHLINGIRSANQANNANVNRAKSTSIDESFFIYKEPSLYKVNMKSPSGIPIINI